MTDEHSPDSQPTHENAPDQEHPAQEAESPDVWKDGPPVDDFKDTKSDDFTDPRPDDFVESADLGHGEEDMATVSQEATQEMAETGPPEAGRSRFMLPFFAGVILLLGGVAYWEFGRSSPPPIVMTQTTTPKVSASPDPRQPVPSTPPLGGSGTTDLIPPYKQDAETTAPPPANAPTANGTAPTTAMLESASPTGYPGGKAGTTSATPSPIALPGNTSPESASTATGADSTQARIGALTTRIDELQKSLDQATRQLNQVSNMVAADQAAPPPATGVVSPVLEDRLNRIEQTMAELERSQAAAKTAPVTVQATVESPQNVTKTASSQATSRPGKHKHPHKKPQTSHHKSAPTPVRTANASSSSWILRAATPSEAWISADATSPELRHVAIGDVVAGIGRVRAIRQSGNGWEVEGSDGTIR